MKLKLLLIGSFCFIFGNSSFSQIIVDSKAKVNNVDFNLVNNELIITYDIINSKSKELFEVKVNILTESGKLINAKSFKGEVGQNITGGQRKTITWDISKDIAFLEDQIYVEIEAINQNPRIIQPVTKGKAILLSTIYPGLGSSKISLKGYHLIKGLAAYGAIAGSFMYNEKSDQSFLDYHEATTPADRDLYFAASQDQKQASKILLYTTGALWLFGVLHCLPLSLSCAFHQN